MGDGEGTVLGVYFHLIKNTYRLAIFLSSSVAYEAVSMFLLASKHSSAIKGCMLWGNMLK